MLLLTLRRRYRTRATPRTQEKIRQRGGPTKAPTSHDRLTKASTESQMTTTAPTKSDSNKYTIGVYHYPWHGSDFHDEFEYLRGELEPPQFPALGEYDDTEPAIIGQHLQWSRDANINPLHWIRFNQSMSVSLFLNKLLTCPSHISHSRRILL